MNYRSKWIMSLLCLSLGWQEIDASTTTIYVNSDADPTDGSNITFRDAIIEANSSITNSTIISLDPGINPSIVSTMSSSTRSVTIQPTDSAWHTIQGNGQAVLYAQGTSSATTTVTVNSNIQFTNAALLLGDYGTICLTAAENISGIYAVQMQGTSPILQFAGTAEGEFSANLNLLGVTNTITVNPTLEVVHTGYIQGTSTGLQKTGTGTLVIQKENAYSGGTAVVAGTLAIEKSSSLGTGNITISGGATLEIAGGITLANPIVLNGNPATLAAPSGPVTVSGVLSGVGGVTFAEAGPTTLTGASTYTGPTTVASGGVVVLSGSAVSIVSSSSLAVEGSLDVRATTSASVPLPALSGSGGVEIGNKTIVIQQTEAGSFSGVITGTTGGVELSSSSTSSLTLSSAQSYRGDTTVTGGTLALSGAGSIAASSAVVVNGTLDISSVTSTTTIFNVSGSGTIVLGEKELVITQQEVLTFSGPISGNGGALTLSADSTSALILDQISTYTGPTHILNGYLALSGSGSIASSSAVTVMGIVDVSQVTTSTTIQNLQGAGLVSVGTKQLVVLQTSDSVFSGVIMGEGNGEFVIDARSTATLTLQGENTLTGVVRVLGGGLSLEDAGSISSARLVEVEGRLDISASSEDVTIHNLFGSESSGEIVLGDRNLTIVQTTAAPFSGVISGSGGVTIDAHSTKAVVFSSEQTYTGPTHISGGKVVLAAGGSMANSSSIRVDGVFDSVLTSTTVNNLSGMGYVLIGEQTLTINQSQDLAFEGEIIGLAGGIVKKGLGVLWLLGHNSFTGPITVEGGTLIGSTYSFPSSIDHQGESVIFQQDTSGTYAHSITGTGALYKRGRGIVTLTNDSTFSGQTYVQAGGWMVNASWANSAIEVSSGALLGGNGTVGSLSVSGIVGGYSGTLQAQGTVDFAYGSMYAVTVDGEGVSKLISTNNITINAESSLWVLLDSGCVPFIGKTYSVLQGGGSALPITGTFGSITTNSALVQGVPTYTGGLVNVTLEMVPLAALGFEGNSKAVAIAIDDLLRIGSPAVDGIVESLLFLDTPTINQALNQMQPALFKGISVVQENTILAVANALSMRMYNELDFMRCPTPCENAQQAHHLWMDGFGDSLHEANVVYAQSPQLGYQSNSQGTILGFDRVLWDHWYVGGVGAYSSSHMHWVSGGGKAKIQAVYGGVYTSFLRPLWYGNASAIGSWSHATGKRQISYPGVLQAAFHAQGGQQLLVHGDTGINYNLGGFALRPFDSLDYGVQKTGSFVEKEAGEYNLSVESSVATMLRNELGVQVSRCFTLPGSRWIVTPKLSFVKEIRTSGQTYTASFAGTTVPFKVTGYTPNRGFFSAGMVFSGRMCQDLFLFDLYYNGEFGRRNYSNHLYGGQMRFGF